MVCSNSFRSDDASANAVGLLHEEMRRCGSLIMASADRALYASKQGGRGRAFFAEDLVPEDGAGETSTTGVDAA